MDLINHRTGSPRSHRHLPMAHQAWWEVTKVAACLQHTHVPVAIAVGETAIVLTPYFHQH